MGILSSESKQKRDMKAHTGHLIPNPWFRDMSIKELHFKLNTDTKHWEGARKGRKMPSGSFK